MNDFSEIKNLTDLVLASGHVKLVTDLLGYIHEVYARDSDSINVYRVNTLVGKSLTDCSNLELVKKITETINIVHQTNQPAIQIISFPSKEIWIQVEMEVFPISSQKFLITLSHQSFAVENIPLKKNGINLHNQIELESLEPDITYDYPDWDLITKSENENKPDPEFEQYLSNLKRSTIRSLRERVMGHPFDWLAGKVEQRLSLP